MQNFKIGDRQRNVSADELRYSLHKCKGPFTLRVNFNADAPEKNWSYHPILEGNASGDHPWCSVNGFFGVQCNAWR